MKSINWTREMLARFKKRYQQAVDKSEEQFNFDGNDFVTDYAKYLIEYLDEVFA